MLKITRSMCLNRRAFLIIPFLFLLLGIWTLSDYGFNWDEPVHFLRGQAYLHYYLTGNRDYADLPAYPTLSGKSKPLDSELFQVGQGRTYEEAIWTDQDLKFLETKRSSFQNDAYNFNYMIDTFDGYGHPAGNGILASLTNYIFYQKLHLLPDIESYHLFEIIVSSLLILFVSYFVYEEYGITASLVASVSLAFYPLFWAESHFNIKDPVVASFYGIAIILFYWGFTKNTNHLIWFSSLFAGFALATKFNAIFLAPTLLIWLLFWFIKKSSKKNTAQIVFRLMVYALIVLGVFYLLWPYLWFNPIGHLLKVISYYRDIGTEATNGWNTYPLIWIVLTTPLPILGYVLIGFVYLVKQIARGNDKSLLILLWLVVPLIRVSLPDASIYGGVRQIMEYIPALAIIAGVGAFDIKQRFGEKISGMLFVAMVFISAWEMIGIHPNQNTYFNQLIGGLSGARQAQIDSWGNSYGNAYLQGVEWLNENAQPNARVALPIATMANLPKDKLRSDIVFHNKFYSGVNRKGEYLIELFYDWEPVSWYAYQLLEQTLTPVYEVKVDGVAILKIWKNDYEHTKIGFKQEKKLSSDSFSYIFDNKSLFINFDSLQTMSYLKLSFSDFCDSMPLSGQVMFSSENSNWDIMSEPFGKPQIQLEAIDALYPDFSEKGTFLYLFPATELKYIKLELAGSECYFDEFNLREVEIKIF